MKNIFKIAGSIASIFALTFFISCGKDDGGEDNPNTTIINFSDSELTVAESDGSITLTIDFDRELAEDAHFTVQVSGTATFGEDYTIDAETGVELFHIYVTAGQTSASITLDLVDDLDIEVDETIVLELVSDLEILWPGDDAFLMIKLTSEDYEEVLVAIGSTTSELFMAETGNKLLDLSFNNVSFGFISSFGYDVENEVGYVIADAKLQALDLNTGEATILFDNTDPNVSFNSFYDILVDDESILFSSFIEDDASNGRKLGLSLFEKESGSLSSYSFISPDDINYSGGLANTMSDDQVYFGSFGGKIYTVNRETGVGTNPVQMTINDLTSFIDDFSEFNLNELYVLDFATAQNGSAYALVESYESFVNRMTFLVEVDFTSGETSYIRSFNTGKDIRGLSFVPTAFFE